MITKSIEEMVKNNSDKLVNNYKKTNIGTSQMKIDIKYLASNNYFVLLEKDSPNYKIRAVKESQEMTNEFKRIQEQISDPFKLNILDYIKIGAKAFMHTIFRNEYLEDIRIEGYNSIIKKRNEMPELIFPKSFSKN